MARRKSRDWWRKSEELFFGLELGKQLVMLMERTCRDTRLGGRGSGKDAKTVGVLDGDERMMGSGFALRWL